MSVKVAINGFSQKIAQRKKRENISVVVFGDRLPLQQGKDRVKSLACERDVRFAGAAFV